MVACDCSPFSRPVPLVLSKIHLPHSVVRARLYRSVQEKEGHATPKKGGKERERDSKKKEKENQSRGHSIFSLFHRANAHLLVASALLGDVALRALGLEDLLAAGDVCGGWEWRGRRERKKERKKDEGERGKKNRRKSKGHGGRKLTFPQRRPVARSGPFLLSRGSRKVLRETLSTLRRRRGQMGPRGLLRGRRRRAR